MLFYENLINEVLFETIDKLHFECSKTRYKSELKKFLNFAKSQNMLDKRIKL